MLTRTRWSQSWLSLGLGWGLLGGAHVARAAVDDPWLRLEVGGGYACFVDAEDARHHGLAVGVDGLWGLNGAFVLRGGYQAAAHRGHGAQFALHQLALAPRYQLDLLAYVPWIELAPGLLISDGEGGPGGVSGSVALGFGVDWLVDPRWSLAFGGHLHQVFGVDRMPAYLTLGLRLGYRFTLGDPFAP